MDLERTAMGLREPAKLARDAPLTSGNSRNPTVDLTGTSESAQAYETSGTSVRPFRKGRGGRRAAAYRESSHRQRPRSTDSDEALHQLQYFCVPSVRFRWATRVWGLKFDEGFGVFRTS